MTQEQKRIKIAEACGWRLEYIHGNGLDCEVWVHPDKNQCWPKELAKLPDYFNDLNAMHEAEKKLPVELMGTMAMHLSRIIGYSGVNNSSKPLPHAAYIWHATAAQRAEAFGKTLNLW